MTELLTVVGISIFIVAAYLAVVAIVTSYQNKKLDQKWIKEKEEERLLKEKRDAEIKKILKVETEDNEKHLFVYSFKLLHCLIQNKLYVELIESYLSSGVVFSMSSGWLDEDLKFKRRLPKKIKQNLVELNTQLVLDSILNKPDIPTAETWSTIVTKLTATGGGEDDVQADWSFADTTNTVNDIHELINYICFLKTLKEEK